MAEHRKNDSIIDADYVNNEISTVESLQYGVDDDDDHAGDTVARGVTVLGGDDDVDVAGFTTTTTARGITVTGVGGDDDIDVDVDVVAGGSAGFTTTAARDVNTADDAGESAEFTTTAARGVTLGGGGGGGGGLAERLREIMREGGGGDLLMQQSERESNFLQWLQALDWQVIGACRADERLKPLLKLNAVDAAEDRLLAHLCQHFEASEVGLLARCLCVPLVSMRVGKVVKQGSLLCPTNLRII